jgi:putative peptidoglycan binding protein/LysM domain-containing protein
MPKCTVKQGDCVSSIAEKYGLFWEQIWNHPNNAKLKEKRKNPNILYPGDVVFFSDKKEKAESGSTNERHLFRRKKGKLMIQIRLLNVDEQPLAETTYRLDIGDKVLEGITDSEGLLLHEIPADSDIGTLYINECVLPIKIGHLDPIDEVTGWQARLHNLGYNPGPIDGHIKGVNGKERLQFQSAVRKFQSDYNLKVDGIVGPKTKDKLKEVHGC